MKTRVERICDEKKPSKPVVLKVVIFEFADIHVELIFKKEGEDWVFDYLICDSFKFFNATKEKDRFKRLYKRAKEIINND